MIAVTIKVWKTMPIEGLIFRAWSAWGNWEVTPPRVTSQSSQNNSHGEDDDAGEEDLKRNADSRFNFARVVSVNPVVEALEGGEPWGAEFEVGELKCVGQETANRAGHESEKTQRAVVEEDWIEEQPTQNQPDEGVRAGFD